MVAGVGNNPAVNLPIRMTIEALMEGGKTVTVVIDSTRNLTDAEKNEVIRKVQALGKIYIIGVNTKSFEFSEQPGRVTFKREKITGSNLTEEKIAEKSSFAELLNAKEQKLQKKQAPLMQKPEDQRSEDERQALDFISKRIEGVTEAKRVFVAQSPQPALLPLQPQPGQPLPPPPPKFEYTAQSVGADETAGFGKGTIKTSSYEFAFRISSKNKKLTPQQFQEKAAALEPVMSLYAKFLERFPEAVVNNPKGRSADFRKFVSNELKKMDNQLQEAIMEPGVNVDLRGLADKQEFLEGLRNNLEALPKPARPSFKERLKALNPKSPERVFSDRFALEIEFKKIQLPHSTRLVNETRKKTEELFDFSKEIKDRVVLELQTLPDNQRDPNKVAIVEAQKKFAEKAIRFQIETKDKKGKELLDYLATEHAKECFEAWTELANVVSAEEKARFAQGLVNIQGLVDGLNAALEQEQVGVESHAAAKQIIDGAVQRL